MQSRPHATSTDGSSESPTGPLDVHSMRRVIEDRIAEPEPSPEAAETKPKQDAPSDLRSAFDIKRAAKIAAGALIAGRRVGTPRHAAPTTG